MLQLLNAFHANVYKMTVPQESRVQVELGSFIAYSSQGCVWILVITQVQDQETIIWNVSGTYAFPDSVEKSVDLELDFGIDIADYNLEREWSTDFSTEYGNAYIPLTFLIIVCNINTEIQFQAN
ncbi:hypothetical protein Tco_1085661 [Tanacetum coccineum]